MLEYKYFQKQFTDTLCLKFVATTVFAILRDFSGTNFYAGLGQQIRDCPAQSGTVGHLSHNSVVYWPIQNILVHTRMVSITNILSYWTWKSVKIYSRF